MSDETPMMSRGQGYTSPIRHTPQTGEQSATTDQTLGT
jgi:hypothetical protein